jgi:glucan endo-1,3-alpha-glucosidase
MDTFVGYRCSPRIRVLTIFRRIVSWNDFGTSHYIGPIHFKSEVPAASVQYLQSHDAWRDSLPYYIAKYKRNTQYSIGEEQVTYWYIRSPTSGGSTCGVVGNNALDGQTELSANAVVEDGIFFSALLVENATVSLKIGNFAATTYAGVAGINHWSRALGGETGVPYISLIRNGIEIGHGFGMKEITAKTTLSSGCTNYNPWVGSFTPLI